jgi:hypothetical protein
MNDEEIIRGIAYLDSGLEEGAAEPNFMVSLVRDAIQIEMAKHGYLRRADDLAGQVASLEKRMELMQQELMRRRRAAAVVYVRNKPVASSVQVIPPPILSARLAKPKVPTLMIWFYALGLISSLAFATLLALSTMHIETIHPFISLLGLIGSLGWLTTAWTDLLLWKREKPSAESTQEERPIASSNPR